MGNQATSPYHSLGGQRRVHHAPTRDEEQQLAWYAGLQLPPAPDTPCSVLGAGATGCVVLSADRKEVVKFAIPFYALGRDSTMDILDFVARKCAMEVQQHQTILDHGGADIPCIPQFVTQSTCRLSDMPTGTLATCFSVSSLSKGKKARAQAHLLDMQRDRVSVPVIRYKYVGRTLADVVREPPGTTVKHLLQAVASVFACVGVMNARGIVHMDISMRNLTFLDTPRPMLMLIDFERGGARGSAPSWAAVHNSIHFRITEQFDQYVYLPPELACLTVVSNMCENGALETTLRAYPIDLTLDQALRVAEGLYDSRTLTYRRRHMVDKEYPYQTAADTDLTAHGKTILDRLLNRTRVLFARLQTDVDEAMDTTCDEYAAARAVLRDAQARMEFNVKTLFVSLVNDVRRYVISQSTETAEVHAALTPAIDLLIAGFDVHSLSVAAVSATIRLCGASSGGRHVQEDRMRVVSIVETVCTRCFALPLRNRSALDVAKIVADLRLIDSPHSSYAVSEATFALQVSEQELHELRAGVESDRVFGIPAGVAAAGAHAGVAAAGAHAGVAAAGAHAGVAAGVHDAYGHSSDDYEDMFAQV